MLRPYRQIALPPGLNANILLMHTKTALPDIEQMCKFRF